MLPEFSSAARVSEYVCDLEYLFLPMNVGSYGTTEPHQWFVSKIPTRTWDNCRTTSERKSRTQTAVSAGTQPSSHSGEHYCP